MDVKQKVQQLRDREEDKDKPKGNDPVNHPKHYTFGKFEVIEVVEDWKLDFSLGNAVKYIARAQHKNNELEDLKKAAWYLQHRIAQLEFQQKEKK